MKLLLPSLVHRLAVTATAAQRESLIQGELQASGFEWLSYVGQTSSGTGWDTASSICTSANREEPGSHGDGRHGDVDPRVQDAGHSSMPLVWDRAWVEACVVPSASPRLRQWAEDLLSSGAGSGVLFNISVAGTHGGTRTLIDLVSLRPVRDWLVEPVLTRALMLGFSLHEFYTYHAGRLSLPCSEEPPCSILLPVQQEIAHHLLQGRSDKEIAALLQLSSHAVDYHMRQLRQRFAARNRVQVVSALRQSAHAAVPGHA